ncbi:FAD-dependent monooxygenase [Candidatus Pelagibacter sp.]|nr:FAD-dependent monooxygenase [Candidatus Pelagibacter sp.]
MKKVSIIGAGISGLYIANLLLQNSEYEITIYEKNNSIKLEKGYGIQLSVNSVKLLNKIGFQNINSVDKFNPSKLDFYTLKNSKKICDLNLSIFNDKELKYTTIQRSVLIKFLKEKIPSNLINYNKKVVKAEQQLKKIKISFEDNSIIECDYLIICDGVFSSTKSLIAKKKIKPKYFNSIAIRATINKDHITKLNQNNISLFLGSNLHSVIYPISESNEFNFIAILKKKLTKEELSNYSLLDDKTFISSIISEISKKIDTKIIDNLKDVMCFPIFVSKEIYIPKNRNIFLIGDAFFAFPPTFAQGASQSVEVAYELYANLQKNQNDFNTQRIQRTKMIYKKSKFNYFIFHISNPLIVFIRNLVIKYLVKNTKFINSYLGKIYKN